MPEQRDWSRANLDMVGYMLGSAGVVMLLGALIAHATGENLGSTRSHLEATMVLGTLGVACLVAVAYPITANYTRARAPRPYDEKPGRYYPPEGT